MCISFRTANLFQVKKITKKNNKKFGDDAGKTQVNALLHPSCQFIIAVALKRSEFISMVFPNIILKFGLFLPMFFTRSLEFKILNNRNVQVPYS